MESVELKVTFRTDRDTAARVKSRFPGAKVRGGSCEVVFRGDTPSEVSATARRLLEEVRGPGKGFKGKAEAEPLK